MVEKIKNVKSFRCFAAIICQEPERKFKMSLESVAVVLLRVQVLLSKRLTVVTVSRNESHSLYTGTQVGLAGDTVYC